MSEGRYHELENPMPISAAQATASEQAASPIVGYRTYADGTSSVTLENGASVDWQGEAE